MHVKSCLFFSLFSILTSHSIAAAQPADPEIWAPKMSEALVMLLGDEAGPKEQITPDMQRLIEAFADDPLLAEKAPEAFIQAAELARTAENPATRGVAYDLARVVLETAAKHSDAPPGDFAPLAAWQKIDPTLADTTDLILARSDAEAMGRLAALDPELAAQILPESPEDLALDYWEEQDASPTNRVLPSRLNAWVAGVEGAWPDLSPDERKQAMSILTQDQAPSDAVLQKVIGTRDVIFWLASMDVPMTDSERAGSPELVHFIDMGAFAGPLRAPIESMILSADAPGAAAINAETENQLMRLNNWSASEQEMHSWKAYRYSTEGY